MGATYTAIVSTAVRPETRDDLERLADDADVSVSTFVREMIEEKIASLVAC
jgi:predicted DNA-binding protein